MPSAKAAEAIAQSLWRIYGPEIEVRFRDAGDPDIEVERLDRLADIDAEDAPLPTLLLDGELLFAGTINPLRVVAAVAERMLGRRAGAMSERSPV